MNSPALFRVSGLAVTPYPLLLAAGAALCLWLAWRGMRRAGVPRRAALMFAALAVPLGLACARLLYGLIYLDDTLDDPLRLFALAKSGYTLYGAGAGVLLALLLAARSARMPSARLTDAAAPAAALMIACARLLEGLAGTGYSLYVTNPALCFFPVAVYDAYWEAWAFALFVPEGLYALGIALALRRGGASGRRGDRLALLLFLYAVMQIWFESLRRDAYARVGFIRVMQLASAVIAGGVLLYWLIRARRGALYALARFAAYLALLGVVMLMEFAVEYKVGFLLALHERWHLTQNAHYLMCYGVMLLAALGALALGLRARGAALHGPTATPPARP